MVVLLWYFRVQFLLKLSDGMEGWQYGDREVCGVAVEGILSLWLTV
jgi:hypothetical protein